MLNGIPFSIFPHRHDSQMPHIDFQYIHASTPFHLRLNCNLMGVQSDFNRSLMGL